MKRMFFVLFLIFLTQYAMSGTFSSERGGEPVKPLSGKEVYSQSCAMCHANGVGGAPRPGRVDDWVERNKKGTAELLVSVLRGKGGMPPKGGNASLSRAEAYVALDYMMSGGK